MLLPDDHDDLDDQALDAKTVALRERAARVRAQGCANCGRGLCGHDAVLAIVFGCSDAPRCAPCLAAGSGEPVPVMLGRAFEWLRRRDCYLHVWREAGRAEGFGPVEIPPCLGPVAACQPPATVGAEPVAAATPAADAAYDAGDLGCGDLVLELRFRMQDLPPGGVLQVTAHDPAAPVDLPAWCGLCGHTLLHTDHPQYWIRRKGERR